MQEPYIVELVLYFFTHAEKKRIDSTALKLVDFQVPFRATLSKRHSPQKMFKKEIPKIYIASTAFPNKRHP